MAGIRRSIYLALVLVCMAGVSTAAWTSDDTLWKTGRLIAEKNAKAVVTIQLVLEQSASYGGQTEKNEQKMNATGTVIDPSGLVVTSLNNVDPRSMMRDAMEDSDFKMTIKVTDALIRLDDGTEIPMNIVVRDGDLNLAFLKPKEPVKTKLAYVNLKNGSTPLMLDNVLTMSRLGQVAGRSIAANYDEIMAVVKKPRKFYVLSFGWAEGGPAFTTDGKTVGIVVPKGNFKGGYENYDMLTIIMPAETVMQAAAQAQKPKK